MKKIGLTIAGSLLLALGSLSAQERTGDTTGTGTTPSTEYQYQWRNEDREQLTRDDLPSGLIETLESGQFEGWENATIYRNKTSSDYMLVIQDQGNTRTFYFDKEGKELTNPDNSGSSSSTQYQSGEDVQGEGDQGEGVTEDSTATHPEEQVTGDQSTMGQQPATGDQSTMGQQPSTGQVTSDTTKPADQSSSTATGISTQTGSTTSENQQGDMQSNEWNKEDRVVITTNELPSSLLITLGDPKFRGWDNSSVYRNRKTNEYMIEIRDGSDTRTYYFDKDGKEVEHSKPASDKDDY